MIKFIKTIVQFIQLELESKICFVCGGKNSPTSQSCLYCGEKFPGSPSQATKVDKPEPIQLTQEEKSLIEELEDLQSSKLGGRIIHLLKMLDELPKLSQESIEKIKSFTTHKNDDIRITAKKIVKKKFIESSNFDPDIEAIFDQRI